jgi:hypothetical protein
MNAYAKAILASWLLASISRCYWRDIKDEALA